MQVIDSVKRQDADDFFVLYDNRAFALVEQILDSTQSLRGLRHIIVLGIVALSLATVTPAGFQNPPADQGAAGAWQKLAKLRTTASVLHTTAHPDDEHGGVLTMLGKSPQVSFDIGTLENVGGVAMLIEQVSAERVLYGSHAPFLYPEAAAMKIRESALSGEMASKVLSGNANRMLKGA